MSQMKNKKQNLKIDIAVIRSPRTNMRSSKHLTLKSKKSLLTTSTTLDSKKSEVNEIDEIIKNSNFRKKLYSKSLVNPYIPLTKFDKVKEITEMDEKSSNRLKKYSSIFEQIKKEIYDINNMNISNKTKNIEGFIDEKEEEDFTSPKYISNNINYNINYNIETPFNCDCDEQIDIESLNENIKQITLSNSKENESMGMTKMRNKNKKLVGFKVKRVNKKLKNSPSSEQVNFTYNINNVNKKFVNSNSETNIKKPKEPLEYYKEENYSQSHQSCNCFIQ